MSTWKIYADIGLTTELSPVAFSQANGGAAVSREVYVGSVAPVKKLQKASSPGVDMVALSVVDTASGTGLPSTAFKLALTYGGLASAVAGDPLDLGPTLFSGVGNAVPVYVRADAGAAGLGTFSDIQFGVLGVIETDA